MKRKFLLLLLAIPAVSIHFSAIAFYASTDVAGEWNLKAYVYNTSGTNMDFRFVNGTSYSFKSDLTGTITSVSGTSAFNWTISKKTMTITADGSVHKYKIVECSPSQLLIVDRNAGTDENGSYSANEKGLMFSK